LIIYTWRTVQIIKLLIMQFSPASYHFNPRWRPKYVTLLRKVHDMFNRSRICSFSLKLKHVSRQNEPSNSTTSSQIHDDSVSTDWHVFPMDCYTYWLQYTHER
jgi:hypothetical protein